MLISLPKLTPTITAIDIQDDEEVLIVVDNDEVALQKDEIGNMFQDTSPEDELVDE